MGIRVSWSFLVLDSVLVFCFSFQVPEFFGVWASPAAGNVTDRLALLEFKSKITHDPLGAFGSWNESTHFCNWHGITCSRRHQRVTVLNLESLKISGSISPYIGNLSFLKVLNLQNNSFTHVIPSEIGRLRRLQVLGLNNNSIGGEIPVNISRCSNLVEFSVFENQLEGKIPSEFGSFSKTEFFALSSNNLIGSIPSSFGNLTSIHSIYLSYNNLAGSIPDTFGHLENLVILALGVNRLSGTIPSSIFNISSINTFDVGSNQIKGRIPLDFGYTLPNLQFFSIAANQITGTIPLSISNASKLKVIQVNGNSLTGEVPHLEKLQRLSLLQIADNNLGRGGYNDLHFLCSLTNATSLRRLHIDNNNFGGSLSGCICNISTTLEMFVLNRNKIFGSIPSGIGKFFNLQKLDMGNNQLSGTILPVIGELQNLVVLSFSGNRLSGNIPPSLGHLKKLLSLNLSDNFLQGRIPSSLGQCESLAAVDLSDNILSGIVSPQFISLSSLSVTLDLSRNYFTGSLPTEVGKLKNLGTLDVSGNKLKGEIPSTLGSCIRLENLELQDNLFQGPIPSSLSSLRGLRVLDLSQNNLSGKIPEFLVELKLVEYLNLSYNDLEGMVPAEVVFKNVSATSILGNNKLCGGIPEFKLPTCGSKKSEQGRLTVALKLVIAVVSGLVGLAFALSFLFLCWVRRRKEKPNPSCSINLLPMLSYQSLYNATNGFSSANLIGAGSFGSVYKGILNEDRTTIAVKVFNLLDHGAAESFTAECNALTNIRHRNLVKVLTACSGVDYQGNDFKALVYEFMHNGSLEEWLHPITAEDETDEALRSLNLLQRLNIAMDVACALNYLHHDCQPSIAHRDLKPSNVLLDDEMSAHVGDFGLARLLPSSTHMQTSSTSIKGSIGYIAPECGLTSELSIYGDVYSYGILLLELVTSKRPTDIMFEGDMNLHKFVRTALPDLVMDIMDSTLLNGDEDLANTGNQKQREAKINSRIECLNSIARIGVACSMESPQDRMSMTNVVHELQSIKKTLLETRSVLDIQRGQSS